MAGNGHASHVWKEKRHEFYLQGALCGVHAANVGFLSEADFFNLSFIWRLSFGVEKDEVNTSEGPVCFC